MKAVEPKNIRITFGDGVAEVALARPELRNAFNPEMIVEITEAFKGFAKNPSVQAIVLRGEGKAFCAGADLHWMKEMVKYSLVKNRKDSEKLFAMFEAIYCCPHPVIGLIHGSAFGGALGLMACCDFVVAETATQFCFSEVKLGLVPAVISYFVLQKTTLNLVAPWMLMGRVFSAVEAQAMGLAHIVVPENQMESLRRSLIQQLKENGPEAVRETKKLLQKIPGMSLQKAKIETTKVIAARRVSKEGQEGLQAFLEKRLPAWKKGSSHL